MPSFTALAGIGSQPAVVRGSKHVSCRTQQSAGVRPARLVAASSAAVKQALTDSTIPVSSSVATDATVPEAHKGLHSFLYGAGGAEEHDTVDSPASSVSGLDTQLHLVLQLYVVAPFCCPASRHCRRAHAWNQGSLLHRQLTWC